MFNALNKWRTKKANITRGFYLGDVRLRRFFYIFHFMAPFLAMAKLKQAWLCPSGLTKTFHFITNP